MSMNSHKTDYNKTDYDTAVLEGSVYDGDSRGANSGVQPVPIAAFGDIAKSRAITAPAVPRVQTLSNMLDVPIPLVFEVGRTKITIAHLMELREGSYISLRNVAVDVIDVRVNDRIVAEAEAISLQTRYGIRISEISKLPGSEEGDTNV